jgi:ferrous iron transport protein A
MRTLNELKTGETGVIQQMGGDRRFISRAGAMGFTPNTPITMLFQKKHGPVIVYLRDTQVALSRKEAVKIYVGEHQV